MTNEDHVLLTRLNTRTDMEAERVRALQRWQYVQARDAGLEAARYNAMCVGLPRPVRSDVADLVAAHNGGTPATPAEWVVACAAWAQAEIDYAQATEAAYEEAEAYGYVR